MSRSPVAAMLKSQVRGEAGPSELVRIHPAASSPGAWTDATAPGPRGAGPGAVGRSVRQNVMTCRMTSPDLRATTASFTSSSESLREIMPSRSRRPAFHSRRIRLKSLRTSAEP